MTNLLADDARQGRRRRRIARRQHRARSRAERVNAAEATRSSAAAPLCSRALAVAADAATPRLVQAVKSGDRATALDARARCAPRSPQPKPTARRRCIGPCEQNDLELVDRLLRTGADASGRQPLRRDAAEARRDQRRRRSARAAARRAAAMRIPSATTARRSLMTVARGGHVDAARLLLKRGAEIDARETLARPDRADVGRGAGPSRNAARAASRTAPTSTRARTTRIGSARSRPSRATSGCRRAVSRRCCSPRAKSCLACVPVLIEARRRRQRDDTGRHQPDRHRVDQRPLRRRGRADRGRNGSESRRLHGPHGAVRCDRLQHDGEVEPAGAEGHREPLAGLDVARLLLEHGADVNAQLKRLPPYRAKLDRGNDGMLGGGTTPFLRAAKAGDVPAMKLLLEHGADPTLAPTRSGISPLMAAAGLGTTEPDTTGGYKTQGQAIEAIQLLLDLGAGHERAGQRRANGRARRSHARLRRRHPLPRGEGCQARYGGPATASRRSTWRSARPAASVSAAEKASCAKPRQPCYASCWPRSRPGRQRPRLVETAAARLQKPVSAPIVRPRLRLIAAITTEKTRSDDHQRRRVACYKSPACGPA